MTYGRGGGLGPALAQRNGNYQVTQMNFDLWCQEQAGLPVERCDKRTPQDNAAFEAYRAKVEAYEIPYLQQKEQRRAAGPRYPAQRSDGQSADQGHSRDSGQT